MFVVFGNSGSKSMEPRAALSNAVDEASKLAGKQQYEKCAQNGGEPKWGDIFSDFSHRESEN